MLVDELKNKSKSCKLYALKDNLFKDVHVYMVTYQTTTFDKKMLNQKKQYKCMGTGQKQDELATQKKYHILPENIKVK